MSSNPWVIHVKKWSKDNNVSYGCAISMPECKDAYQIKKNRATLEKLKKPDSIRSRFPKKEAKKEEPKKEAKKDTGKVTKEQLDKMAKEIEALREKAGRIAEREGKVTSEVSKLMEKKDQLTKQRLMLLREYKQQQKKS